MEAAYLPITTGNPGKERELRSSTLTLVHRTRISIIQESTSQAQSESDYFHSSSNPLATNLALYLSIEPSALCLILFELSPRFQPPLEEFSFLDRYVGRDCNLKSLSHLVTGAPHSSFFIDVVTPVLLLPRLGFGGHISGPYCSTSDLTYLTCIFESKVKSDRSSSFHGN
ncbi:unnamed protein product [Dovyalis caffra]|uniref:Maturase K n=1 Tax=Dovyalis caffra TaxID=77055 RepID=A0AAV1R6W8_9ROSI|nr:unnamed protein product [Dovyalis caffra]